MTRFIVDASVAVKWVVAEQDSADAVRLLECGGLAAPELIFPECANILWTKVQRGNLSLDVALIVARVLESADLELVSHVGLLEPATRLAVEIGHPAYDCAYLALAIQRSCPFVTADDKLVAKVRSHAPRQPAVAVMTIGEAAGSPAR